MKNFIFILTMLLTSQAYAYEFASPNEASGQIIMSTKNPAKQLFPVFLQQVNGENTDVRSDSVWLTPGSYELVLGAQVDRQYTRAINTMKKTNSKHKLNIDIEQGKTYYVAFDASSQSIKKWKPVIYRVE